MQAEAKKFFHVRIIVIYFFQLLGIVRTALYSESTHNSAYTTNISNYSNSATADGLYRATLCSNPNRSSVLNKFCSDTPPGHYISSPEARAVPGMSGSCWSRRDTHQVGTHSAQIPSSTTDFRASGALVYFTTSH